MSGTLSMTSQDNTVVEKDINALIIQSKLPQTTSKMLKESFNDFFDEADKWEKKAAVINVTTVDQSREMKMAKEIRLAVRDIRIKADKTRISLKEESTRYNKAVQGIYTVIEAVTTGIEAKMLKQEKFKEDYDAKIRADLAHTREEMLKPYEKYMPSSAYQSLGSMKEEDFKTYLDLGKSAVINAEAQAEKDRIEANKQAKILKAKEKKDEEERERLEKAKSKAEAKAKEEKDKREKAEAESKAKLKKSIEASEKKRLSIVKQKEAAQAKARKLQDELNARKKAEAKKALDEAELKAKAEQAPDKENLFSLAHSVRCVRIPIMKSKKAKLLMADLVQRLHAEAEYIEQEANRL